MIISKCLQTLISFLMWSTFVVWRKNRFELYFIATKKRVNIVAPTQIDQQHETIKYFSNYCMRHSRKNMFNTFVPSWSWVHWIDPWDAICILPGDCPFIMSFYPPAHLWSKRQKLETHSNQLLNNLQLRIRLTIRNKAVPEGYWTLARNIHSCYWWLVADGGQQKRGTKKRLDGGSRV